MTRGLNGVAMDKHECVRILSLTATCAGLAGQAGCGTAQHRQLSPEEAARIALRKAEGKATPDEEELLKKYIEATDAEGEEENRR